MNLTKLLLVAFIGATVLVLNIAAHEWANSKQGARSFKGIVSSQNGGSAFRPGIVGVKDKKDEDGKAEGGEKDQNRAEAIRKRRRRKNRILDEEIKIPKY